MRQFLTRSCRWLAVLLLFQLSTTLACAESSVFRALAGDEQQALEDLPAHYTRWYVHAARGELRELCPQLDVPVLPGAGELSAYILKPPAKGLDFAYFGIEQVARFRTFTDLTANAEEDVRMRVQTSGCAPATHAKLLQNGARFLQDVAVAGSIEQIALDACRNSPQPRLCECFAVGFDMQTLPRHRRALVPAEAGRTIQTILKGDNTLLARVGYKCGGVPDIAPPVLGTALNQSQELQPADWHQERRHSVFQPRSREENQAVLNSMLQLQVRDARNEKVLVCKYGKGPFNPRESAEIYSFWHRRVWVSPAQLRAVSTRHPLLLLGSAAVQECPATLAEAQAFATANNVRQYISRECQTNPECPNYP